MKTLLLLVSLFNAPQGVQEREINMLWAAVQRVAGVEEAREPVVYFETEESPGRSGKFLAFYYEHTNVIRVNKVLTSRVAYQGYTMLVIGHEMMHYLHRGMPVEFHHCYFVNRNYQRKLAEFLVENGMGHPILLVTPLPQGCDLPEEGR